MNFPHLDSDTLKNVDVISESSRLLEQAVFALADTVEPELISTLILLTARLDSLAKAARKQVLQRSLA